MSLPDEIQCGDLLGPLSIGPITRHDLALYCGASGDHNPIHVDIDFARASGRSDVFAHGMLAMAYLGRLLTDAFGASRIRAFKARFVAIVEVGDTLTCAGRVTEIARVSPTETRAHLELEAVTARGVTVLKGSAEIEVKGS